MKILRKINRSWQWIVINIIGLALAFACVILVFFHTQRELSFDRFHSKADRIYRATTSTEGSSTMHPARVWGEWVPRLPEEYPAIESVVRMVPFKKGVVEIEQQRFFSDHLFKVDSSFFDIYDFELLSGNRSKVLSKPNEAVIARSMALKYYGTVDVLGKELSITHQQNDSAVSFTIVGVMEDFPPHSHFHADILTTIPNMEFNNSWGYTYYLMEEGTDIEVLRNSIQQQWDKNAEEGKSHPTLHFQKLTDIHLYSHKTREMEPNGDVKSLILLISGAAIILFISLINFLNLSRVQFISGTKTLKIKLINGATKGILAREIAMESLLISIPSVFLGLVFSYKMTGFMDSAFMSSQSSGSILFIALIFITGIAFLSVYPLLTSQLRSDTKVSRSGAGLYTYPLVLQFTLAVIAITGTIVLNRQMSFLNEQHPQAENANIVVIERSPWAAVQRYEQFKAELLKNASIENMTGAMEEPGGDILDNFNFSMEGVEPQENQSIYILTTDSNFFTAMGIRPIAGSVNLGFTPSQKWESDAVELSVMRMNNSTDEKTMAELEDGLGGYREKYILNESALKMLGINDPEDAIGRSFQLKFHLPYLFPEGEIVAVVPDFHYTNLHNKERPLVIAPRKMFNYNFLIWIDANRRKEAIAAINTTWSKINPEFPLEYQYINDSYQKVYATEYVQTRILSYFAIISLLLSALGIFAISAFSTQRRVKEIGIRKVNGASVAEIIMMLNKGFVKWVALAFVIAIPLAWYAMHRWLEGFAYKTDLSWWIFALAGLIALAVALITASFQSYRAAVRNPVESLKYE